jgi:hypothetical protein
MDPPLVDEEEEVPMRHPTALRRSRWATAAFGGTVALTVLAGCTSSPSETS